MMLVKDSLPVSYTLIVKEFLDLFLSICNNNNINAQIRLDGILYTATNNIQKGKFDILLKEINLIVKENHLKGIVVGNPVNMDGTLGKSSQSASDFAKNLSKNITIPITLWDERLSSEGSFKITRELNTNVTNRVKKLDKNAAAFILQGAIDYLSN